MYESGPAPSSFPAVAFAKFGRKLSKFLLTKYKLLFCMMFYSFRNSRHQKHPPARVATALVAALVMPAISVVDTRVQT